MTLIESIKSFWPLLFTFVLPRALGYFNTLKTAYRTRPPPKPLPPGVNRSLNFLFCSILFFVVQSFARGSNHDILNIFSTTNTRVDVPSDILFARLAMLRPNGILTEADQALRSALTTKDARMIYLTHGPNTFLQCPFCHPSQPHTYMLYGIPTTILLPHLIHATIMGLATSPTLTSPISARYRYKFLIPALVLLAGDLALNTMITPQIDTTQPSPASIYALFRILRVLWICMVDACCALYLWTLSTNRFLLFPFLSNPTAAANSVEELQAQSQEYVRAAEMALGGAQAKMRAVRIARSAVVRDEELTEWEEGYWREVRRRERGEDGGREGDEDLWQDEEVQAAVARVYGSGGVDVPRARKDAGAFVEGVTRGLEESTSDLRE